MRFAQFVVFAIANAHLLAATTSSQCNAVNQQALGLVAAQRTVEAEAQLSQLAAKMAGSPENKVCLAVTLSNWSQTLERLGKIGEAEQVAVHSISLFEETVGPHDVLLRVPLIFLAQTAIRKEEFGKASKLLSQVESLPEATHADLATTKGLRADLLEQAGALSDAEESYRESIAENDLAGRGATSSVIPELQNLAMLYINQHRIPEALPLLERAVSLTSTPLSDIDTRVQSRLLLAICLSLHKDKQRAEGYFQQAIQLLDALPPAVRPTLGRSVYLHYASFLHDTGHKRESNSLKQKAQALFGSDPGPFTVSVDSLLAKR
jgi:tetratricopeptide (TPR) repeat protein